MLWVAVPGFAQPTGPSCAHPRHDAREAAYTGAFMRSFLGEPPRCSAEGHNASRPPPSPSRRSTGLSSDSRCTLTVRRPHAPTASGCLPQRHVHVRVPPPQWLDDPRARRRISFYDPRTGAT